MKVYICNFFVLSVVGFFVTLAILHVAEQNSKRTSRKGSFQKPLVTKTKNLPKPQAIHHVAVQNSSRTSRYKSFEKPLTEKSKSLPLRNEQLPEDLAGQRSTQPANQSSLPTIYVITATYLRPTQIADLTRLSHTLRLVPSLFWLLVEDAYATSPRVRRLLERSGLPFAHLHAPMPRRYRLNGKPLPRGVSNRNRGLKWLRANATSGVFYFADDDNTYDLDLFEEMRYTKRVSMWPVGLVSHLGLSSPIVHNGAIVGFYEGFPAKRKFPVDMAGFAVSVKFLLQRPRARMPFCPCHEEDGFLRRLRPLEVADIEVRADNCTRILVWHTKTRNEKEARWRIDPAEYRGTNIVQLRNQIL